MLVSEKKKNVKTKLVPGENQRKEKQLQRKQRKEIIYGKTNTIKLKNKKINKNQNENQ